MTEWPSCAVVSSQVGPVAPVDHWKVGVAPDAEVPMFAVNVDPGVGAPEIVGVGAGAMAPRAMTVSPEVAELLV